MSDNPKVPAPRKSADTGRLLVWLVAILTTAGLFQIWSNRSREPVPPDPTALANRLAPVGAVRPTPATPPAPTAGRPGPATPAAAPPDPAATPAVAVTAAPPAAAPVQPAPAAPPALAPPVQGRTPGSTDAAAAARRPYPHPPMAPSRYRPAGPPGDAPGYPPVYAPAYPPGYPPTYPPAYPPAYPQRYGWDHPRAWYGPYGPAPWEREGAPPR